MSFGSDEIVITATARRHVVACPECGQPTRRVHSRYRRTVGDLPWHGMRVRFALSVRKFFCDAIGCPRRIFTERLPATAAPYARRTTRAAEALDAIGLALGGLGGARLATALGLVTSPSSVLRYVRRIPLPASGAPRAVGIDDWAWRKGMVYGTIVVDLEQGRVLDLLPDREAGTVTAWLRAHPEIEVISRDRSDQYAEAARDGAPQATQVADRFHLIKNLGDAVQRVLAGQAEFLRLIAKDLAAVATDDVCQASASDQPPALLTPVPEERSPEVAREPLPSAERRASAASRERRRTRYAEVMALRAAGATLRVVATSVGMSIGTVHRWIHSDGFPERSQQRRRTDTVADAIRRHWAAGCQNAAALWRMLRADGFTGSQRSVQREIERLGLNRDARAEGEAQSARPTPRPPSARHLAWLFGRTEAATTPEKWRFVEVVCSRSAELARVRTLAQEFVELVVSRNAAAYDAWLGAASDSLLVGFARSLRSDDAAVRAALSLAWSNGPTEGHINRLKLLKRTMYGRASLDLLRQRVLAAV